MQYVRIFSSKKMGLPGLFLGEIKMENTSKNFQFESSSARQVRQTMENVTLKINSTFFLRNSLKLTGPYQWSWSI